MEQLNDQLINPLLDSLNSSLLIDWSIQALLGSTLNKWGPPTNPIHSPLNKWGTLHPPTSLIAQQVGPTPPIHFIHYSRWFNQMNDSLIDHRWWWWWWVGLGWLKWVGGMGSICWVLNEMSGSHWRSVDWVGEFALFTVEPHHHNVELNNYFVN